MQPGFALLLSFPDRKPTHQVGTDLLGCHSPAGRRTGAEPGAGKRRGVLGDTGQRAKGGIENRALRPRPNVYFKPRKGGQWGSRRGELPSFPSLSSLEVLAPGGSGGPAGGFVSQGGRAASLAFPVSRLFVLRDDLPAGQVGVFTRTRRVPSLPPSLPVAVGPGSALRAPEGGGEAAHRPARSWRRRRHPC